MGCYYATGSVCRFFRHRWVKLKRKVFYTTVTTDVIYVRGVAFFNKQLQITNLYFPINNTVLKQCINSKHIFDCVRLTIEDYFIGKLKPSLNFGH